jgi:hypothetical protein
MVAASAAVAPDAAVPVGGPASTKGGKGGQGAVDPNECGLIQQCQRLWGRNLEKLTSVMAPVAHTEIIRAGRAFASGAGPAAVQAAPVAAASAGVTPSAKSRLQVAAALAAAAPTAAVPAAAAALPSAAPHILHEVAARRAAWEAKAAAVSPAGPAARCTPSRPAAAAPVAPAPDAAAPPARRLRSPQRPPAHRSSTGPAEERQLSA